MADSQDSLKSFVEERGGVATGAVYRVTMMRRTVRLRRTAEWKVEVRIPLLSALKHLDCGPEDTVEEANWVTGNIEFDARLRVRGDPVRCWQALSDAGIAATLQLIEPGTYLRDGNLHICVGSPYVVAGAVAQIVDADEAFPPPREVTLELVTRELLTAPDRRIRSQLAAVLNRRYPLPTFEGVRIKTRFEVACELGPDGMDELEALVGSAPHHLLQSIVGRLLDFYETQPDRANAIASIASDRLERSLPAGLRVRALRLLRDRDAENAGRTAVGILTDRLSPAALWIEAFDLSASRQGLLPMGAIGDRLRDHTVRIAVVDRLIRCGRQDTLNLVVQFMRSNPSLAEEIAEHTVATVSPALDIDGYLDVALGHLDREESVIRALNLARDHGTSALISAVREHASGIFRDRDVKAAANGALLELRGRAGGEAGALAIASTGGELSELRSSGRLSTDD